MFYLKASIAFLIISAVICFAEIAITGEAAVIAEPAQENRLIRSVVIFACVLLLQLLRYLIFRIYFLENRIVYYIEKLLYCVMISAFVIFTDIGIWFYLGFLLPLVMVTFIKGPRYGYLLLLGSMAIHLMLMHIKLLPLLGSEGLKHPAAREYAYASLVLLAISVAVVSFSGKLYEYRIENEFSSKFTLEQLDERCLTLENERDIIKKEFITLISSSGELEKLNKSLSKSIAEFYTLNQISQAIGSILDTGELLKRLNDIILGVVGCSYSTIILFDEKLNRLKVYTTNIAINSELATLTDHINSGILKEALDRNECILENNVDYLQYSFTSGRNINSLMCIPLTTTSRKYGLILVEHTVNDAFDEDNIRFLRIIAQQVGIVMENAELYYKMKELARKDGLTGIYNRQYFQERLEIEFCQAKKDNYPLSLVIFDIDHFKKFNDMYGHIFGDKVLTSVAEVAASHLRKGDMIARYGGEEFIILLPRTNLAEAYEKVENLRKLISQHIIEDNLIAVSVTASFGVSSFDECAFSESDLIRTADDALYEAKESGRNCVMTARRLYESSGIRPAFTIEHDADDARSNMCG